MRTLVLTALAGALLCQLSVAANAADVTDPSAGKPATSIKRIVPTEMVRDLSLTTKVTPGSEKRGSQLIDPAGLTGHPNAGGARDQDTAAAAAERTTTNASRMGPSEAAATIPTSGTPDTQQ